MRSTRLLVTHFYSTASNKVKSSVWRLMCQRFSDSFSDEQIKYLIMNQLEPDSIKYATIGVMNSGYRPYKSTKHMTCIRVRGKSFRTDVFSSFYKFSHIYRMLS